MSYSLLGTQWVRQPGEPNPVLTHPVITVRELSRWWVVLRLVAPEPPPFQPTLLSPFPFNPSTPPSIPHPAPPNPPKALASDLNKSPAQVVIRWALQRGMTAIPRSSNPDHMADNLAVLDFELSADDMGRLNALDGTRQPGGGGGGPPKPRADG